MGPGRKPRRLVFSERGSYHQIPTLSVLMHFQDGVTFSLVGEFEGPLYFKINQGTGQVSVARDLTEDLDRFYNVSFYLETGCLKLTTLLMFG